MRALPFALLLAAGAASATTWPSVTMPPPETGGGDNDAAVVIGISNYASLPPIPGAADNANDWFRYLTKTRKIPLERIRLVQENEATKETIEEATREVAEKVGAGGTVWYIFIGHGAPNAPHDDGLLVGFDTQLNEKSLEARGVPQKWVLSTIEADAKHTHAVVVWDACFSGSTGDGRTPLVPGSQATVPVKRIAPGAAGRAAILSASDQVAGPLPGHDRPAFTYLLLGALRGWADKPPAGNNDATVTTVEAFNYARDTLRVIVRGRVQVPSMSGSAQPFALSKNATEKGPDLVDIVSAAGPAADLFRQRTLTVPVIDTSSISGFALGEMNMQAERAFENAQDAQESSSATAESKREAWCALAGITDRNPYLEMSQTACTQWSNYVTADKEMVTNMTSDFAVLVEYVQLRRRTPEMKIAAVDSFLDVYGKYADRQEVLAAKVARDNLGAGKPAGIALDSDGDNLIVDSCPTEAEDYDGDSDSDGCPEKGVGDMVGEGLDDVEDAMDDVGLHFYIFDFATPFLQTGIGGGLGVYDEAGVPTKFNQPTFRPSLGWSNRAGWGPLEVGANIDWDLTRDIEDEAFTLDPYAGIRIIGISMWTPSVGLDYRNAFDWAPGRVGGPGVYFGNMFNIENAVGVRVTYRYGLEAPGSIVPVHSVFAEVFIMVAHPKGSACLELLDELDLCD